MNRQRSVVVVTLGVTQTLSWASSYYLTAIFADPVASDLHISRSFFFGVVSAALLASGLLGPAAGRMIDRRGGRDVLAGTNLCFAGGLASMAFSHGPLGLILAWSLIAVGMGFGLYEAAFATATGLYGQQARNAIIGITLIAGFASTVGWPTSRFLVETVGWRDAALVWATLHLVLGLPMNRFLIPKGVADTHTVPTSGGEASPISKTMLVLAGVFGATWFISASLAAHLPRLLQAMGATPDAAVAAAALVGPAQVGARLFEFGVLRRVSPMFSARLSTILNPIGAVLLAVFGPVAAVPYVLLHGAGNGMLTIARGTLPLALFGPSGYGMRTGILAAPARVLQGAAPLAFGYVLDNGGPRMALLFSGVVMALSCLTLCLLRPGHPR
jgi:MFS family permease